MKQNQKLKIFLSLKNVHYPDNAIFQNLTKVSSQPGTPDSEPRMGPIRTPESLNKTILDSTTESPNKTIVGSSRKNSSNFNSGSESTSPSKVVRQNYTKNFNVCLPCNLLSCFPDKYIVVKDKGLGFYKSMFIIYVSRLREITIYLLISPVFYSNSYLYRIYSWLSRCMCSQGVQGPWTRVPTNNVEQICGM